MKEFQMLIWLTQLGFSVAAPLAGFSLLGLWLRARFSLGAWVLLLCIALGLICAVSALRSNLKLMERMDGRNSRGKEKSGPPVSFNEHE